MKQKIQILTSIFALFLLSTSCIFLNPGVTGDGNVMEEKRKTENFEKIKVGRGMNVYLSQGDKTTILVKADENLLDLIETKVEDNVLKVTTNTNIRKATSKKVFITVPEISAVQATAGGNIFSETMLTAPQLEVRSSAGSNIKLELTAEKLKASASAGSNIMFSGTAKHFQGKSSSGSNIKAGNLSTENCEINASSGANIWITTKKELNGTASSGANIFYYGNPETTNIHKSSGANVTKKSS